jgi:hypothetical protein
MKITAVRKIRALCKPCLKWPSAAWKLAKAGSGALALGALWVFAGSCWSAEPPIPAPQRSASAFPVHGGTAVDIATHRFDLVIVEPKGRGPQGYRYRIVVDSATRGAESSLDLATGEGGLLVTARDVDGAGDDLDLIIKNAKSLTPVGVWINDHHGGFTKADASVYAPSIWSDGPLLLPLNSPDTLQGAILFWHQPYIHPSTQRCPGERWIRQGFVEPADLDVPSRLTADPQRTRGPPRLPL